MKNRCNAALFLFTECPQYRDFVLSLLSKATLLLSSISNIHVARITEPAINSSTPDFP